MGGVFGEAEMTDSGYPRTVAPLELGVWKRCCDADVNSKRRIARNDAVIQLHLLEMTHKYSYTC